MPRQFDQPASIKVQTLVMVDPSQKVRLELLKSYAEVGRMPSLRSMAPRIVRILVMHIHLASDPVGHSTATVTMHDHTFL